MISWEQAFEGVTNGIPGLDRDDFEMVPKEDGWVGVRLPQEMMFELLRTPTYLSIQGDRWQFCCRRPMIFIGEWNRRGFMDNAPDGDGRRLFQEVMQEHADGMWESHFPDAAGIYVFRCPSCGRKTAYYDMD